MFYKTHREDPHKINYASSFSSHVEFCSPSGDQLSLRKIHRTPPVSNRMANRHILHILPNSTIHNSPPNRYTTRIFTKATSNNYRTTKQNTYTIPSQFHTLNFRHLLSQHFCSLVSPLPPIRYPCNLRMT